MPSYSKYWLMSRKSHTQKPMSNLMQFSAMKDLRWMYSSGCSYKRSTQIQKWRDLMFSSAQLQHNAIVSSIPFNTFSTWCAVCCPLRMEMTIAICIVRHEAMDPSKVVLNNGKKRMKQACILVDEYLVFVHELREQSQVVQVGRSCLVRRSLVTTVLLRFTSNGSFGMSMLCIRERKDILVELA